MSNSPSSVPLGDVFLGSNTNAQAETVSDHPSPKSLTDLFIGFSPNSHSENTTGSISTADYTNTKSETDLSLGFNAGLDLEFQAENPSTNISSTSTQAEVILGLSPEPGFISTSYETENPDGSSTPTRDCPSPIPVTDLFLGLSPLPESDSSNPFPVTELILGLSPLPELLSPTFQNVHLIWYDSDKSPRTKERCSSGDGRQVGVSEDQQILGSVHLDDMDEGNEEKEKRKAKLIGNHLSAQPSTQGKESYVEELENEEMDNTIKHHSICGTLLSDSDGDEEQSESPGTLNEDKCQVNYQDPKIGMVFSSEVEAYEFYKNYARNIGFNVRKGKVQRLSDGTIRKRYFFCSRQGFRCKKQANSTTKYKRGETRTGCDAKIQFTFANGKWVVSKLNLQHNHEYGPSIFYTGQVDTENCIIESATSKVLNEGKETNIQATQAAGEKKKKKKRRLTEIGHAQVKQASTTTTVVKQAQKAKEVLDEPSCKKSKRMKHIGSKGLGERIHFGSQMAEEPKGNTPMDQSTETPVDIPMPPLPVSVAATLEETDSIFADLDQVINGKSSQATSSTLKKKKPNFSEEGISKAKMVLKNCLHMKFENLLHPGHKSELMEALRTLHLYNVLPEGQNSVLEKFHSDFLNFLVLEKERSNGKKLIDSHASLVDILKQLLLDYKECRTQEEIIEREILQHEEDLKKKRATKDRLSSKRKEMACEVLEKKSLLAKYNLEVPFCEERKKKADEASKQVSSSWEDFKKKFGDL